MGLSGIATLTRHYAFYSSSLIHITPTTNLLSRRIRMSSTNPNSSPPQTQPKHIAPYGSWKSPITSDIVSGSTKRLGGFALDSLGHLFWLESRPTESGYICVLV